MVPGKWSLMLQRSESRWRGPPPWRRPAHGRRGRRRRRWSGGCSPRRRSGRSSTARWCRGCGTACPCSRATDTERARRGGCRGRLHAEFARQLHHVLPDFGLSLQHFRRRVPVGPFLLGVDGRRARPAEAFAADADPVANGLAVILHKIEEVIAGVDDDGARRLAELGVHHRTGISGVNGPGSLRSSGAATKARNQATSAKSSNNRTTARHGPHPLPTPQQHATRSVAQIAHQSISRTKTI